MLKNYLAVAFRGLGRQKVYAFINVFGLALGMACCIVMLAFVRHEWTYDAFHEDADNVYRVNIRAVTPGGDVKTQAGQPLPLAPTLEAELPEISAATRLRISDVLVTTDGEETFEVSAVFTDTSFFDVFSFPVVQGADPLSSPQSTVLSRKAAQKFFAEQNPLGRTLRFSFGGAFADFTVAAVVDDPPASSSIAFDVLLPMQQWPSFSSTENAWNSWGANTFARVHAAPPTSEQLTSFAKAHFAPMIRTWEILQWLSEEEGSFRLELQPLTTIHFTPEVELSHTPAVNPTYLYVLLTLAVAVLLVACVNFAVLAVGRSTRRAPEVGLRKVLGAERGQLMRQFWGEALAMSGIALVVGVGMAEAFLPFLNEAANRAVDIDYLRDGAALGAVLILAVVTGLVAGAYPAVYLSRFKPVDAFRGGASPRQSGAWVQGLVVGQFACSIFIIAAVLVGSSQLRFLKTKHLGFDQERVMVIPTHSNEADASERLVDVLEREISALSGTVAVTASSSAFNHDLAWNSFNIGEVGYTVYVNRVQPAFIEKMGMTLVAGRGFSDDRPGDLTGSIVVNEAFVREFELEDPVGRQFTGVSIGRMENPTIVGVVADYHYQSLYESIHPIALFAGSDFPFGYLYVRLRPGDVSAQVRNLEAAWKRVVPHRPFTGYFLDDDFDRLYRAEERWQQLIALASIFTLLIACMGLFGLAAFSAERRTKEIGIRKVLGANVSGLVTLLSKDFVRLVVIAFVIAAPAAYVVMRQWLDDFAYRVEISPATLLAAGLLAVIVALLTVSYQAVRVASADPVTTLRHD